jgi:hypothetical protein
MTSRTWLFALSFMLLGNATVAAATLKSVLLKDDGRILIDFRGPIVAGDAQALKALIKSENERNRLVASVRFNSEGGALAEAAELVSVIQFGKLATVVGVGATCASACFLAFAAGYEKFANYSAFIGIHGASDQSGRETTEAGAATVAMARVMKELGVPAGIIGKMVVTPPSQMVWLSPNDLRSMGTTMVGTPSQVVPEQAMGAQLPPAVAPQTQAKAPPDWDTLVKHSIGISAKQNSGKPNVFRGCQPELKTCFNGVSFKGENNAEIFLKLTEDMNGKTVSREICQFNTFNDVRYCVDWDTGKSHRDMKDLRGDWQKVADE